MLDSLRRYCNPISLDCLLGASLQSLTFLCAKNDKYTGDLWFSGNSADIGGLSFSLEHISNQSLI